MTVQATRRPGPLGSAAPEGLRDQWKGAGPSTPDRSPADLSLYPKTDSSATGAVFRPTLPSAGYRGEEKGRLKSLSPIFTRFL